MKMVKKKKEIKIVREADHMYTFLYSSSIDNNKNMENDNTITISKTKEIVFRIRSLDSKKSKILHRNQIIGAQNEQGHSSVYE
ncbi:MAG TPA: hypothetical protein VFX75_03460 [Nitrososphaeraceae archaeon]|nr:hypothetical protein [Nitrososphaeraceae archaeon]